MTVPFAEKKQDRDFVASIFDPRKEESRLERFRSCSSFLVFDHCRHTEHYSKLRQANFCKDRLCTTCQWRKSLRLFSSVYQASELLLDQSKFQPKFCLLTLTVQNCDIADTGSTIKRMTKAFQRLSKRKFWKDRVQGYFKSLEITFNEKSNTVHPHFHILLHVDDGYFHPRKYTKQSEWLEEWRSAYKDFNITQVDIRRIKQEAPGELLKSLCEVVKYSVKPSVFKIKNLSVRERFLKQLKTDLRHLHLVQTGGSFWFAFKHLNQSTDEDEMDYTDDPTMGVECPECRQDILRTWFRWAGKEYDFRRQTTLRYLESIKDHDLREEFDYVYQERQAIMDRVLLRGTSFNKSFEDSAHKALVSACPRSHDKGTGSGASGEAILNPRNRRLHLPKQYSEP